MYSLSKCLKDGLISIFSPLGPFFYEMVRKIECLTSKDALRISV